MLKWNIEQLKLDLKYTWKISRNSSDFKINSIISVSNGRWKGIGEAAPNIRYQETPDKLMEEFSRFVNAGASEVMDLNDLERLMTGLGLSQALKFGIESAYIHYLCHSERISIYDFLGIANAGPLATSFSLPIMEWSELKVFYDSNDLRRFKYIKVKVNAEHAYELIKEVTSFTDQPLIIDGNESWKDPDEVIRLMESLRDKNIALMEQPMPAGMNEEYLYLKPKSFFTLVADESICGDADFDLLSRQFHAVNMKLMKAGGYLNGLRLIREARARNMKTMIGCMVETTLGISSAMHLCAGVDFVDLDGFLIVKDEPFQLVSEESGTIKLTRSDTEHGQ